MLLSALFCILAVAAPAADNYSVHRRYLNAERTRYVDEVVYYDGLGRPVETVQRGITPSGQSLVALQEYDDAGRPVRAWQPVVGTGAFMSAEEVAAAASALYGDTHAFSTTIYQNSPAETVEGTIRPGSLLASSPVTVKKYVNDGSAAFRAIRFGVGADGSLVNGGLWPDGMLMAGKTVDEDGRTLIEFADPHGRTVLSRRLVTAGDYADTYYVYDGYGDLRYIVPPLASDELSSESKAEMSWSTADDVVDRYCYYYEKNILGQVTLFKQPGREATIYRYDALNRLTLTQDGNQRANSMWTFTFSDGFGRTVATGEISLAGDEAAAVLADSHVARFTGTGDVGGYAIDGNTAFPDDYFAADAVSYYDNYDFIPADRASDLGYEECAYSDSRHTAATGRLTGSLISGKLTAVYYDIYGNEVQRHADNHLGYTDHTYSTFSYTDRPLTQRRLTQIGASDILTEDLRYTYDDKDRPLAVYHSLEECDEVCLQSNTYNELLQVSEQTAGSTARTMTYDLQGRLTSIVSDVFSEYLTYEREGCMSGNISVRKWNNGALGGDEEYRYTYDLLNRLTAADYDGATAGLYSTSYTYDKMGNPLRVSRYGLGTVSGKLTVPSKRLVDNLYYSYTGHHIRGIADRAAGVVGDGALDFASGGTAEEYEYDSNGNLGYDPDRGMAFTYDRNNMPAAIYSSRVVTGGKLGAMSKISSYSYDAAGVRQSVVHTIPATASGVVGGSIVAGTPERTIRRDYVGPMILLDNAVERILIPGGYIDSKGRYCFYLTDYQGNNRAVVDQDGAVVQRTDYYPYGLPLRQTSPDAQPYKYSGKEFDPLNGLNTYDFHARAYFPDRIAYGSLDKKASKYPWLSAYAYCGANPILFLDPEGTDIVVTGAANSSITLTTDLIDIEADASFLGIDWGGNYQLQGEEVVSAALDIVGIVDPTGAADLANTALQAKNGDWLGASISAVGLIPYVGDVAKAGKVSKDVKIIENAVEACKQTRTEAKAVRETSKVVHGNSKASTKAQHLYVIFEKETGRPVKVGISGDKISKGGKSYRATKQVNKLNKEAGYDKYDSRIEEMFPEGPNARAEALNAEERRAGELRGVLDPEIHKRPR